MTTTRPATRRNHLFVTVVTALAALLFVITGAWAFFWPESFFDNVVQFPPYYAT